MSKHPTWKSHNNSCSWRSPKRQQNKGHARIRPFLNNTSCSRILFALNRRARNIASNPVSRCRRSLVRWRTALLWTLLCFVFQKCLLFQKIGDRLARNGLKLRKVGKRRKCWNAQRRGKFVLQNKLFLCSDPIQRNEITFNTSNSVVDLRLFYITYVIVLNSFVCILYCRYPAITNYNNPDDSQQKW